MNDSPHKEKPQKLVSRFFALISNNYEPKVLELASPVLLIKISGKIYFYLFLKKIFRVKNCKRYFAKISFR